MDMERRIILFIILSVFIILFFSSLMQQSQPPSESVKPTSEEVIFEPLAEPLPPSLKAGEKETEGKLPTDITETEIITYDKAEKIIIQTENYRVTFSTLGAKPISWLVNPINKKQRKEVEQITTATMVELIPQWLPMGSQREFPLEFTLREYGGGVHNEFRMMLYQAKRSIAPDGNIILEFISPPNEQKIRAIKTFSFPPKDYVVNFSLRIVNEGDARLIFDNDGLGLGVLWGAGIGDGSVHLDSTEARAITGIFQVGTSIKTATPKRNKGYAYTGDIVWGGLKTRFFMAVIISPHLPFKQFTTEIKERNLLGLKEGEVERISILPFTAELLLPGFRLEPGQSYEETFKLFVGPKYYDLLSSVGYGLQKSLFGWLRPFCVILLKIMQFFYYITLNYGWAIILLTLLVRVVTYPLTIKGMRIQAKAMAEQQRIKPLIEALNQKYKDNPALRNKKLMELYKEHGINPLAPLRGCLPLLLQMPIFIALYFLLLEAIELKGQNYLWIKDLSAPDRLFSFGAALPLLGPYFNLLPILMGASQYFISKISFVGGISDPIQKQMAIIFPLVFTVLLYNFPSGLILYWLVSNVLQVGQQLVINKYVKERLSEQPAIPRSK